MPRFYDAAGGPDVHRASGFGRGGAACLAEAHWELGGCGLLLAQPPPESLEVDDLIDEALAEAPERRGVKRPGGDTVRARPPARARATDLTLAANRELAAANAGLAAELAEAAS